MHRTVAAAVGAALGFVVVGFVGTPRAAADNPVCSQTWCSFLSPSRNIGCEIDYQRGRDIPDEAYCQTTSPPQSVHMSTDGTYKSCTGESCLGNAGEGTPTLPYGQTAGLGPFSCRSEASGITCTVTGRGFSISNGGITPVG
ncbi:hypothetical protein A5712_11880 [Mycobacterium sp. E2327]|uniref:hypothetical protein n=1 Tax=Mycobacterium sp. E2327 TaxID=1834132 RepID=UPI000801F51C|nr:hypothetical protein [Mycobacterium sp. E2327]OBI22995.1 hypothetical protein A5712_11880 [Mycobacterium sp. E2327]